MSEVLHKSESQPGFGPREIDPPLVEGHEPVAPVNREELVARQPVTDTMEAADIMHPDAADPDQPQPPA